MMKLAVLLCLLSLNTSAQNILTYSGPYEDSYGGYGNAQAIYQYYENADYERFYHGDFSYASNLIGNDRNSVTSIEGKFDNNQKIGNWSYSREYKILKKTIIIKGNYKRGLKNGQWTYYQKGLNDISANGITYVLNFRNDTLVGEINLAGLKGNFNGEGEYIGEWYDKRGDRETIAEFKNNILIKLLDRKISTGEIYSKYLAPQDLHNFSTATFTAKDGRESIDKVVGVFEDKSSGKSQLAAFLNFFKNVSSVVNSLQNNWCEFIFLENITIRNPDVPVIKSYGWQEKKVEVMNVEEQEVKKSYSEGIGLDGDGSYGLGGRRALNKERIVQDCNESGIVKVYIEVNNSGQVINAIPGVEGSTSSAKCLHDPAKRAALATRFNGDPKAPVKQQGYIIYNFKLAE